MIPKVIHYCWFGHGEMSPIMKKCLKSWKKYCPDYKIIEWNEDNFDIHSNIFVEQAYECKKWAFVTDYVRLYVLNKYGGIYMDTDVEVRKPLDRFLIHQAFSGFESETSVPTGIIAAEKGQEAIRMWLSYYDNREYLVDGKPNMNPNVTFMTEMFLEKGLILNNEYQEICGMALYPRTYFCPLSVVSIETCITENTYTIHHFTSTWRKPSELKTFKKVKRHQKKWYRTLEYLRYTPNRFVRKIFGDAAVEKLKRKIK